MVKRLAMLAVLTAGAACTIPELTPVTEPSRRLELPGVSVLPPSGENWFVAPRLDAPPGVPTVNLAAFAKKPPADAPERVVYARVNAFDLGAQGIDSPEAFVRFVEKQLETGSARQQVLSVQVSAANSPAPSCARYRRTAVLDASFMLVTAGIWCLHPHWPKYGVDVVYGQRYRRGHQPLPIDAEAAPFVGSVVFTGERPMVE